MNVQNQNFKIKLVNNGNFSLLLLLSSVLLSVQEVVFAFSTTSSSVIQPLQKKKNKKNTNSIINFKPHHNYHHDSHAILHSTKQKDSSSKAIKDDNMFNNHEPPPVLEDVDGIGGLTSIVAASVTSAATLITNESNGNEHLTNVDTVADFQNYIVHIADTGSKTKSTVAIDSSYDTGNEEHKDNVVLNSSNDNASGISNGNNTQTIIHQKLIDPTAIVEAVIGTALDHKQQSETAQIMTKEVQEVVKANGYDDTIIVTKQNHHDMGIKENDEDQDEYQNNNISIDVPNVQKIIKFAIPAIGVWLCSPLLSLIDTSSVGLLSGTTQQAALNPGVAVTDYGALLVAFMYTATTNLVAGARGKEASSEEKPKTKRMLINALQMSAYVGTILGSVLITLGPMLLRAIIGNDSIDPNVFAAALRYVRIRALGMPAAVIIGSAQSACLGMEDIKSPMYVLVAAAVVNFIGDLIFVPQSSALIGGAAGAAWATVFSQYAALAMFMKWLSSKPKKQPLNLTNAILELTGKSLEGKPRRRKFRRALQKLSFATTTTAAAATTTAHNNNVITKSSTGTNNGGNTVSKPKKEFSIRGFLSGREKDLLTSPTLEDAKVFWPYFLPVTATQCGRVSAFVSLIHVVSSVFGTLSLAANQVILSIFYCICPICDSLNLTAQSFLPVIAQRKPSLPRAKALRKVTNNFTKSSIMMSVFSVALVNCIPLVSKYFTSDLSVIALVNSLVPILSGIFAVHGLVCAHEGVLLGQKDLGFLGKSYAAFFFLVPYMMLRVKDAALHSTKAFGLTTVWSVFFGYNIVRASSFFLRSKMLNYRNFKQLD